MNLKLNYKYVLHAGSAAIIDSENEVSNGSSPSSAKRCTVKTQKTFTCPECGKIFNAHYNLTRHMPVHTGARPFVCKVSHLICFHIIVIHAYIAYIKLLKE